MFLTTKLTNYIIGKSQTLADHLKKTQEKLLIFVKEFLKFNYPKSKRVIYEKLCYVLNLPTYLKRKYLGQKLIRQTSLAVFQPISRETGFSCYYQLDFQPLDTAIEFAKERLSQTNLQELVAKAEGKHKYLLALPIKHELTLDSPLVKLALHPAILSIVTQYIGVLPILNSVNILYSANQSIHEHSSQYSHLDPEGVRQIKVFIYLNEVTNEAGPFTLIPAKQSQAIYPFYKGGRLTDEFVSKFVEPEDFTPIMGPAGTMILVDTSSCFHFGSRPGKLDRPAILFQYVSPFAMIFPRFGWQRNTRLAHLAREDSSVLIKCLLGVN